MTRSGSRGRSEVERCAFCDSTKHEVDKLIAGRPDIFICNRCVEICHSILHEDDRVGSAPPPLFLEQIPSPRTIHEKLSEHIVGQEHAKKVLSDDVLSRSFSITTRDSRSTRSSRIAIGIFS